MHAVSESPKSPSVHRRLLGDAVDRLPPAIRQLHGEACLLRFAGPCCLERGTGFWSRLIGGIMGFPQAASDVPVSILIERNGTADIWAHDFNGAPLRSRLSVRGGQLIEHMGPAAFHFRLVATDRAVTWVLVAMKLLGGPVPRLLQPRIQAHETSDGERYLFCARAEYPLIGLLVHYHGWLDAGA